MRALFVGKVATYRNNERGFTLPELLVVISIMGVLFAIATVSWRNITEDRRVVSTTNQMVVDLRLAHSSAANQLAEYYVVFSATNGGKLDANCAATSSGTVDYCLIKREPTGATKKSQRLLPDGAKVVGSSVNTMDSTLASLLGLNTGTKSIRFNASGSADSPSGLLSGATAMTITVGSTQDSNKKSVVRVNQATSRVKVD